MALGKKTHRDEVLENVKNKAMANNFGPCYKFRASYNSVFYFGEIMGPELPFVNHFLNLNQNPVSKASKSQENFDNSLNQDAKKNREEANETAFSQDELESINIEVLAHLKSKLPEIKYKTFFENNLKLVNIKEDSVAFWVRTDFIKKTVDNFTKEISEALEMVLGKSYEISVFTDNYENNSSIKNDYENKKDQTKSQAIKTVKDTKFILSLSPTNEDLKNKVESQVLEHMKPVTSKIAIDDAKTFESFIIGPSNRHAYASAQAVAQNPGNKGQYSSLYIHSNSGLGKTHLLHAVCNHIREEHPTLTICFTTGRAFMEELVEHTRHNTIHEFRKKYSEMIDVLIIDDIHEISNKQGTQDEFFHAFNELHNKGKQLIFTSDRRPKEIDGISERIKTRLSWGLVIDIQPPDIETRMAILKHKAQEIDLFASDEIINYIASHIKNNIRELEGSLIRLKAYSEIQKTEIEFELAKEILALSDMSEKNEITLELIAKATASYYRVQLADLKSKIRNKETTSARHVAMYLARKKLQIQFQEIGLYFGGRDHSSVIHAVKSIEEDLKNNNQNLSKDLNSIENSL